jgi:hypothetical protein
MRANVRLTSAWQAWLHGASSRTCIAFAMAGALLIGGCASTPDTAPNAPPPRAAGSALRGLDMSPALEDRILALDPRHVTAADVRDTLAHAPAPRIVLLHGGIYPVFLQMESLGDFLIKMGYPDGAVRDPGTGLLTHSPYESGGDQAGMIAWYYERDGLRPMLIGHSQGGMQAVKVLYVLAGLIDRGFDVYNPVTGQREPRTSIVDPYSGRAVPLTSVKVSYASSISAGGFTGIVIPNQWEMSTRTFDVPDSAVDFTGFVLGFDFVAMESSHSRSHYRALGSAHVDNVTLPESYDHYYVPDTRALADDAATRAWIEAWTPAQRGQEPPPGVISRNLLYAADTWYSVKEHWVSELQRAITARRAMERH